MTSKYDAKGIIGIALGEIDIKKQPPDDWYSRDEDKLPIIRISTGDGSDAFYALTKAATDNLIRALQDLQALPVQRPRSVFAKPERIAIE